ncbi:hypothetical protein ELI_0237 [Eubacterium callanderi]|uniref:Uncharacterized protein n=1 Tax=Eubacterium callanderi TaxID=53442 RepID=E3GHX2_9FIRM|nr:hypothetical protein ELI_0237 [Eubacterium callanderi]
MRCDRTKSDAAFLFVRLRFHSIFKFPHFQTSFILKSSNWKIKYIFPYPFDFLFIG